MDRVSDMDELIARVVELELRSAFQDDAIASLQDALLAERSERERLARQLERVLGELGLLRTALYPDAAIEPPPPHY